MNDDFKKMRESLLILSGNDYSKIISVKLDDVQKGKLCISLNIDYQNNSDIFIEDLQQLIAKVIEPTQ